MLTAPSNLKLFFVPYPTQTSPGYLGGIQTLRHIMKISSDTPKSFALASVVFDLLQREL